MAELNEGLLFQKDASEESCTKPKSLANVLTVLHITALQISSRSTSTNAIGMIKQITGQDPFQDSLRGYNLTLSALETNSLGGFLFSFSAGKKLRLTEPQRNRALFLLRMHTVLGRMQATLPLLVKRNPLYQSSL